MVWDNKFKQRKVSKKIEEELLPVAWLPIRWWDPCMPEDESKEVVSILEII